MHISPQINEYMNEWIGLNDIFEINWVNIWKVLLETRSSSDIWLGL
jgi:hypothetical protein